MWRNTSHCTIPAFHHRLFLILAYYRKAQFLFCSSYASFFSVCLLCSLFLHFPLSEFILGISVSVSFFFKSLLPHVVFCFYFNPLFPCLKWVHLCLVIPRFVCVCVSLGLLSVVVACIPCFPPAVSLLLDFSSWFLLNQSRTEVSLCVNNWVLLNELLHTWYVCLKWKLHYFCSKQTLRSIPDMHRSCGIDKHAHTCRF